MTSTRLLLTTPLLCGLLAPSFAGDLSFSDPARVTPPPPGAISQATRDPGFDALPGFTNPPPGFGDVGFFWWLGDKLTKERLQWQLDQLAGKGVSGLQINYAHDDKGGRTYGLTFPSDPPLFSEPWWDLQQWFLQAAKKKGMAVSLSDYTLGTAGQGSYIDEILNRYPDIRGATLKHESRRLEGGKRLTVPVPDGAVSLVAFRMEQGTIVPGSGVSLLEKAVQGQVTWDAPPGQWQSVAVCAVSHDLSIDPMHPEIGQKVIDVFFQRFEDRNPGEAGKGLNFFFSDELQFGVAGNLWNARFAAEFRRRMGYDLLPEIAALFVDIGPRTPKIRLDYRDVMVALQEEGYFKPVFDWHQKHGMIYGCDHGGRGRAVDEFGDYFRTQRWNQGPGADQPRLGKDLIKAKVAASIAHLYQRPRVWLEGYYSSGWQTGSAEVADATFANYAMGFNLLTLHGLYYSTKGGWWEWAPPCNHFHMPYWEHMGNFLQCVQRLSFLMSQGHHRCDVAIVYPVAAKEAGIDGDQSVQAAFATATALHAAGIDFDFIDFESLARAEIKGRELHVAGERYRALVLPAMKTARFSTVQKAADFHSAGGLAIVLGAPPEASERAGRQDPELDSLVKRLTTRAATPAETRDLIDRSFPRDYRGPGMVNHRRIGPRDVYLVYGAPKDSECTFRATGMPELWDPWTGSTKPLPVVAQSADSTTLRLPLTEKEVQLVVFRPGQAVRQPALASAPAATTEITLDGDWEFELKPALDNRFGDFHWPATNAKIGAEARVLESSASGTPDGPWTKVTCSFGPRFWLLGPVPDDFEESALVNLNAVDPAQPVRSGGKEFRWKPYEFSWRWGKQGDPGHQGYHGLKGKVSDEFLCLGAPRQGKNETLYGPEPGGNRYYLWTSVPVHGSAVTTAYPSWGGIKPTAVWINHQPCKEAAKLNPGPNPLLVRYDKAGRGFFVVSRQRPEPPPASTSGDTFSPAARWIWFPAERANGQCWFRKRFDLTSAPPSARLRITCDNGYLVKLNGSDVGSGNEWRNVDEHDVTKLLRTGRNEIVVRATNTGDSAGLIAELTAGNTMVATDATWQVAKSENGPAQASEVIASFPDSLWYKHELGPPKLGQAKVTNAKPVFEDKPLAMKWWKSPSILDFDVWPAVAEPVGLFRFTAPPGLRALSIEAPGSIEVLVDGKATTTAGAGVYHVGTPSPRPVPVLIRQRGARGNYGGAGLPEYLRLDCGPGLMPAGDWAAVDGLKSYSGGAWYRKSVDIPEAKRVILDLGTVSASAEVKINGQSAGIRVAPPWTFDLTHLVRKGTNQIEVLVYSTLSNHYSTVPTHYNRAVPSGLLGPVALRLEKGN